MSLNGFQTLNVNIFFNLNFPAPPTVLLTLQPWWVYQLLEYK